MCDFTVDTELKGHNSGTIVHLSGSMTVHWHPSDVGDMKCP